MYRAGVDQTVLSRPFAPSALDRLVGRIDRLPGHGWWVYPLVYGLSMAGVHLMVWAQGLRPVGEYEPASAAIVFYAPFGVAAVRFTDRAGNHAMSVFRRALDLDDEAIEMRRYELVTLPAGRLWACVVAGTAIGSAVILTQSNEATLALGRTVTEGALIALPFAILGYTAAAAFVWHTIRQLVATVPCAVGYS